MPQGSRDRLEAPAEIPIALVGRERELPRRRKEPAIGPAAVGKRRPNGVNAHIRAPLSNPLNTGSTPGVAAWNPGLTSPLVPANP